MGAQPADRSTTETWHFEPRTLRAFRTALLKWEQHQPRELPWRGLRDPYQVWISEIMLQQTTVAAVIPYFQRFLARFPNLHSLAEAPEADVLRLWEGLGYYSRARNLQRAAQVIVQERDGVFPTTVDEWQALPGIGRYTAGAICSFALGQPAPIVEANTLRLYARLLAYPQDPRATAGQRVLWNFAAQLVPSAAPGVFNQALMDLGAQVCKPVAPACGDCPVQRLCGAYRLGLQQEIPLPKARPEITAVTELSVAIRHQAAYWLIHRQPGKRWAGLWDFPRLELPATFEQAPEEQGLWLQQQIHEQYGWAIDLPDWRAEIKHSVTRYRITLRCYEAELRSRPGTTETIGAWVRPEQFAAYPLSVTGRKLADLLLSQTQPPPTGQLF